MDEIRNLSNYRIQKSKKDFASAKILFQQNLFAQSLNRSYYSIFHIARALLAFEKFDSKKHSGIITYFDKFFIKTEKLDKKLSEILHNAEKIRIYSDYDDFYIASREEAEKQLNNASIFISEVESYIYKIMEK